MPRLCCLASVAVATCSLPTHRHKGSANFSLAPSLTPQHSRLSKAHRDQLKLWHHDLALRLHDNSPPTSTKFHAKYHWHIRRMHPRIPLFHFPLLVSTVLALDHSVPFEAPLPAFNVTLVSSDPQDASPQSTSTSLDNPLDLRSFPLIPRAPQGSSSLCASSYNQCPGMPSLCCPTNTQCLPDAVGMVGCCPFGAACTGIASQQTQTQSQTAGASTSTGGAAAGGAAGGGVISTTSAQGGGQIIGVSATAGNGGATIFAAAGRRRAGETQDEVKIGAAFALGVAIGGVLLL